MKKSQIAELYEKYIWEKCSRTTYYKNIRAWMSPLEALKKTPKEKRYKKWKISSVKFPKELERYYQQEWPKAKKDRFYQRLYQWRSKEEAIKVDFWIHYTKLPKKKTPVYARPFKLPVIKKKNKDYTEIRIRYSKEEWDVIKKEYERIIEEIEQQILYEEDVSSIRELNKKIDQLKAEYELFISYQKTDESM